MPVTIILSDQCAAELRSQLCTGTTPPGPTATPPPSGGGGGSGTPPPVVAGTVNYELPWQNTTGSTRLICAFSCDETLCIHFRTPAATLLNAGIIGMAEYSSPPTQRYAVLSNSPGDFSVTAGDPFHQVSSGISLSWNIVVGNVDGLTPLAPDTDYYINVRNTDRNGTKSCLPGQNTTMFCDLRLPT